MCQPASRIHLSRFQHVSSHPQKEIIPDTVPDASDRAALHTGYRHPLFISLKTVSSYPACRSRHSNKQLKTRKHARMTLCRCETQLSEPCRRKTNSPTPEMHQMAMTWLAHGTRCGLGSLASLKGSTSVWASWPGGPSYRMDCSLLVFESITWKEAS